MYKDEVEQEVIDLHKCLQNTVLHKDRHFKQQNIKFIFSSNENNKSVFIKGKYSNFAKMLSNIINNAIEAKEDKPGEICVLYEIKGDKVEVKIKDNGKGIAEGNE